LGDDQRKIIDGSHAARAHGVVAGDMIELDGGSGKGHEFGVNLCVN
jgi:hypothetical protein